jgi:F420H(2)-dependent quinone reductase
MPTDHPRALVLTTRGRRTGRPRTVVVQYFPDGRDLVVAAGEETAAWWPRVLAIAPDYARFRKQTAREIPLLRLVVMGADERADGVTAGRRTARRAAG